MLNKDGSRSQKRILVDFLMLLIFVLRFSVYRFRIIVEGEFTIGNNYSLSDEGI